MTSFLYRLDNEAYFLNSLKLILEFKQKNHDYDSVLDLWSRLAQIFNNDDDDGFSLFEIFHGSIVWFYNNERQQL